MKTLNLLLTASLVVLLSANALMAQQNGHKIVMQLTTGDTLAHKALMKQLANLNAVSPETKIEVVCHGPGLEMMVAAKSRVVENITKHSANGVSFRVCEFSMKERNVSHDQLLPQANPVKAGIIHIVERQSDGWFYIKAGF